MSPESHTALKFFRDLILEGFEVFYLDLLSGDIEGPLSAQRFDERIASGTPPYGAFETSHNFQRAFRFRMVCDDNGDYHLHALLLRQVAPPRPTAYVTLKFTT